MAASCSGIWNLRGVECNGRTQTLPTASFLLQPAFTSFELVRMADSIFVQGSETSFSKSPGWVVLETKAVTLWWISWIWKMHVGFPQGVLAGHTWSIFDNLRQTSFVGYQIQYQRNLFISGRPKVLNPLLFHELGIRYVLCITGKHMKSLRFIALLSLARRCHQRAQILEDEGPLPQSYLLVPCYPG